MGEGGVGLLGLLCLMFVGLKLTDNISWSWWWVTCPLWIPVALFLAGAAAYVTWRVMKKGKA
ncbi:MAG: hypothetical protein V3T77_09120 [Planctomycetota bacterium]